MIDLLNKSHGAMYPWPNLYTWNPIAGSCEHKCYFGKCYVEDLKTLPVLKKKYSGPPRLVRGVNTEKLGKGKTIFVESCSDLFAENVPEHVIRAVLCRCCMFPLNTYLFQSKNPRRFMDFPTRFPPRCIYGTTIETDEYYDSGLSKAPTPKDRADWMTELIGTKMISIEPIFTFNLMPLVDMIEKIKPEFVSIGADSQNGGFREPSAEDIDELIMELKAITELRLKPNLTRLCGTKYGNLEPGGKVIR